MPARNRPDRACAARQHTPRRKPADFPLVLAYVNREQTDLRKQSRNVSGAQRSCWCGFRRFRCWLSRSNSTGCPHGQCGQPRAVLGALANA